MALDVRRSDERPEPGDRLGRIADCLSLVFEADPEHQEGERLMILISPPEYGERGSALLHEYEDENQAKTDLIIQLKALFEAGGQEIEINVVNG